MFKKKNHNNIPKDYDKTLNQAQPKAETMGAVVGDAKTGKRKRPSLFTKKNTAITVVLITIAGIVGIILSVYVFKEDAYVADPRDAEYATINESSLNDSIKIKQDLTSRQLTESANLDEKTVYYSSAIWLKIGESSNEEIADYYIQVVKPEGVVLALDLQESILKALLATGNDSEAKELIDSIIIAYSDAEIPDDDIAKDYINQKKNTYEQLKDQL